jgi:hypothetical protein
MEHVVCAPDMRLAILRIIVQCCEEAACVNANATQYLGISYYQVQCFRLLGLSC